MPPLVPRVSLVVLGMRVHWIAGMVRLVKPVTRNVGNVKLEPIVTRQLPVHARVVPRASMEPRWVRQVKMNAKNVVLEPFQSRDKVNV